MVSQALAALDEAEIADDAVIAATHASESCSPELIAHTRQHPRSMHSLLIPSNLDAGRIIEVDAPALQGKFRTASRPGKRAQIDAVIHQDQ